MSNIKEPYSISVWEEELIPAQDWYVKGEERLIREEYEQLSETEREGYELHTVMEHYEETQGIIIGAHDMDSVYAAVNPILKKNVNGSVDLTFGLYYKVYDPDALDFCINPFTQLLVNEAKVKLHFRGKWYDLVVKNCVEDSTNFMYNYTCKDIYVNELNKNGFKVELETKLKNNQAIVTELAETILLDTDWQVDKEGSDILVETKIEPLYIGTLNQDVTVKRVSEFTPDDYADMEGQWAFETVGESDEKIPVETITIAAGSQVLFFYSDIVENVKQPQFLARLGEIKEGKYTTIAPDTEIGIKEYQTDANEDIIINSYNYQIIEPAVYYINSEMEYNIPSVTTEKVDIYDYARGEKVIQSQLSGYDPDLDQFIFKFYKKDDDGINPVEYYGYTKTEHLTSDLAQNYLANSDNFTSLESGWYFDGVPAKTIKTRGKEKTAAYSGQIFSISDPTKISQDKKNGQESVLVLQLRDETNGDRTYYPDTQGEYYLTLNKKDTDGNEVKEYHEVSSNKGKVYENSIRAWVYDQRDYYVEGYADKTDEELDDIINEILLSNRYSYRSRYAINTGVAANRKTIETLTPGEEYLFAVSLGKFSGDNAPEYGSEIQYGGKVPTEFYTFSDSEEHRDFIIKAVREVLGNPDDRYEKDENNEDKDTWASKYQGHKYYYHSPEYENIYTSTYNLLVAQAEKEYEDKFLFGLNSVNSEARNLWKSGGKKYRNDIFLDYLRGDKTFEFEKKGQIKFCEYLAEKIQEAAKDKTKVATKQLYDILIQRIDGTNSFTGLYPTMIQNTINKARAKQKEFLVIDSFWEPMVYNDTLFPEFDNEQQFDIVGKALSFNEHLFCAFYQGLKLALMTGNKENGYEWNKNVNSQEFVSDLETLLKTIYKAIYEEGTPIDAYQTAKEYKMPGLGYPEGGEIYRAYKARWEASAAEQAEQQALNKNIEELFSMPECIALIGEDKLSTDSDYNKDDTSLDECYDELINLANFIQDKLVAFKQDYSIEQIEKNDYTKALTSKYPEWVEEFLNNRYLNKENGNHHNETVLHGKYYYANFLPEFLDAWVSQQEIGTYVLAEDRYELNNGSTLQVAKTSVSSLDIINAENKIKNPTAKHFVQKSYSTSSEGAEYAAIKTNYNPYTNTNADSAGGYVFDRNDEVIRLYDPERDMIGATYKPVKSDNGDYIYDVFEQLYRPFRNWSVTIKKNPVTLEDDEKNGVYGDVIKHTVKAFDGHIGSWEEAPTRYNMVRLREDPEDETKYKYLSEEKSFPETGHYKGKVYNYTVTYPKGYQLDNYREENGGKYIKASDVRKPKRTDLLIRLLGESAVWKLLGAKRTNDIETPKLSENKNLLEIIKDRFSPDDEITQACKENDQGGVEIFKDIKKIDYTVGDAELYDEDRSSVNIYAVKNGQISVPVIDDIENRAETENVLNKGYIELTEAAAIDDDTTTNLQLTETYIKYKPWYWRHWGKKRYNYVPKICVQKTINGLTVYKPFNNIEDKISDDYRVKPIKELKTSDSVAFYLKNRKQQFRTAKEYDYGARKYRMELRDKKKTEYWVESPNGEDYLRHYRRGDGEIKLWDGHFGRWIDCFEANERLTDEKLDDWKDDDPNYPGLVVSYNEDGQVDVVALPVYYLPYNDIMIPWDARVLSRKERYTRQRVKYEPSKHDELYVLSDGIYKTLSEYYNDSGFTNQLSYDGLKVSFITDFSYDAANFSIKDLPDNRDEYLSFDLSKQPSKNDYIDIVISKTDGETIKERWIYWKGVVKKQFSLTENPLQTIGMLFEIENKPNAETLIKDKSYPFLGMQMFKYIPYEKKEVITDPIPVEKTNDEIQNEVIKIYNELFGHYDKKPTLLTSEDYDYIISVLQNNGQYAAMVSKLFSEYGYVWDINNPTELKQVKTTPIKQPLFPGQPPDARDLYRLLYYIYDPEKVVDIDDVVYEYVGTEPYEQFDIAYDPLCQKVRSIKGKESNYFKLLQDCCDTFDCWLEHDVAHDDVTGQVKYIEKPVYVENNFNFDYDLNTDKDTTTHTEIQYEPQMYVGQDAKERALDKKIEWYKKRFGNDIKQVTKEINGILVTQYEVIEDENGEVKELDDDKRLELKELNRLSYINENLTIRYILVPDKKIRFKRYVGRENWNGFKYGVNLKHIKRTVDSNQISTRVIVKPNKNEYAKDNFCTIQRAHDNPIKENFLYDFSYYVQQGLLSQKELNNDLYTNLGSRLNYYNELARINKDNDKIIEELSGYLVDLDEVTANYQLAVLRRDAALEEIQKAALVMTSNYDTYGQIIDTPWTPNKSQEYITRKQTSAPASSFETTITISTDEAITVTIDVPKTATIVDYPKYNDALRSLLDNMDVYQEEYAQSLVDIEKYEKEKNELERKIELLQEQQRIIVDKKNELNKLFYHKYSRFIQEGSWVDENYIDDNLYYLDALSVMRTSCKPKITYDIGVVDIAAAYEYEEDRAVLESEIGDRTYVEDIEFFGYREDKITPYWELVVVSEKTYNLNDPSQNQTKVKNYSTQFDDLFQRIAATSQTLQFNEGSYNRAASILNDNGTINAEVLQQSIENSADILVWSNNEHVVSDTTGITLTNSDNANVVKLVSRGIILSTDGGTSWKTAITGSGINADLLTTGQLNTKMLLIGNSDNPNFFWNDLGLSAFRINDKNINYSSFVRLDQYGIYGIQNHDVADKTKLSLNDTFAPRSIKEIYTNPNAVFGLTWDGFFLNASNGTGRVSIGTEQDFKMSEFSDRNNAWMDKVIIGRLSDNGGNEYYGFRLKNDDDQIVMETNENGELYLKRKLRISNFSDISTYDSFIYSEEKFSYSIKDEQGNVIHTERTEPYYKKYTVNERGQNYIEYYNLTDFSEPFYIEENDDVDWRDFVSDPQDRVTLGIVDIYKRGIIEQNKEGFVKVPMPKEIYSSTEYLTKVLSIKVNNNIGLEEFTEDNIKQLIEKNETFAIFDNGNLYAKNAWIEGHIQATSGYFRNVDIFGELKVGKEDNTENIGRIFQADGNWSINGDGTAFFQNAVISGKISTAIFEKQKIQMVGGSLIVAPQLTVKDVEPIKDSFYKIICEETTTNGKPTSDFSDGSICKIGNTTTDEGIIFEMFWNEQSRYPQIGTNSTLDDSQTDPNEEEINIVFYAKVLNNKQIKKEEKERQFIFCLSRKQDSKLIPTMMLGLNGRDNYSILPEESFSVFENIFNSKKNTYSTNVKAKLGRLGAEVPLELQGTYGLYSDNAYLKGTLITQSENIEAGVSTNGYKAINGKNIVFWAGLKNSEPVFSVTEDGVLVANKGVFKGRVEATEIYSSTIYTSRVIGFDNGTGLCFDGNGEAIRFINGQNEYYSLSSTEVKQTIDLKVFDYTKQAPLTFGVLNNNQIIGLFGSATANTVNDFGMSIKQNEQNEVEIYHKGMLQMTLSSLGVSFGTNQQNTALGEKVYSLDSIDGGRNIGCDIYVES